MSKVRTLHFSYAKMTKLRTHRKMSTISNDYSFPIQTTQNCVLDRNVHYINHYTFPIQTCQNCVLITNVHYISHSPNTTQINSLHIPIQTCQNCVHAQLSTNSTHYTFLTKTSQNCATPAIQINAHYININHYTFTIQIDVHYINYHTCTIQNKCPLYQSLHISYTNKPKLRSPIKSLHFYYTKKDIQQVLNPH
jgi:hypothetical protein